MKYLYNWIYIYICIIYICILLPMKLNDWYVSLFWNNLILKAATPWSQSLNFKEPFQNSQAWDLIPTFIMISEKSPWLWPLKDGKLKNHVYFLMASFHGAVHLHRSNLDDPSKMGRNLFETPPKVFLLSRRLHIYIYIQKYIYSTYIHFIYHRDANLAVSYLNWMFPTSSLGISHEPCCNDRRSVSGGLAT